MDEVYLVLPGLDEVYLVLPGFDEVYLVLLGFWMFYLVLPGLDEVYLVLPGFELFVLYRSEKRYQMIKKLDKTGKRAHMRKRTRKPKNQSK